LTLPKKYRDKSPLRYASLARLAEENMIVSNA
jgi:hypothetical protein